MTVRSFRSRTASQLVQDGVFPLTEAEIRFLPQAYKFFILNYVVREGARFFRPDLCSQFRRQAAHTYLPSFETMDVTPLLRLLDHG